MKGTTLTPGITSKGGIMAACVATEDGLANDPIARVFGCPDCPGMVNLSGIHKTFCYWVKRPLGQLALAGLVAGVIYLVIMKE